MYRFLVRILIIALLVILPFGHSMFLLSCSDDDDDDNNDSSNNDDPLPTSLQLTNDNTVEMYNRIWPGENKIIFEQPRDNNHVDICSVPLDGCCSKTILSPGANTYHAPDINPAASHICYATGLNTAVMWEIGLLEIGGSETILTDNESLGYDSHLPVFNGDGSKIGYVRRDWTNKIDTLVIMNASGEGETVVCTLPAGTTNMIEILDWLNGQNQLIYTSKGSKLYRVEASAGATPVQVDDHVGYHTCFSSPDGTTILCAQSHGTGQQYIEINPDGTNKRVLVDPSEFPTIGAVYCQVCWLPDKTGLVSLAQDTTMTDFDFFLLTNFD